MRGNLFLSLVLTFLTQISTFSQVGWKQISLSSGLASEEVYKLVQDDKGYVWAFTELEAQKFNGRNFEKVPGFPTNSSVGYAVLKDDSGKIWICNSLGDFGFYQNDTFQTVPYAKNIKTQTTDINNLIYKIKQTDKKNFILRTYRSPILVNKKTGTVQVCESISSSNIELKKVEGVWNIHFPRFSDNKPFIITSNYFFSTFHVLGFKNLPSFSFQHRFIHSIDHVSIEENQHGLWIFIAGDLIFIDTKGKVSFRRFPSSAIQLKKMPDDKIWVGLVKSGLYVFSKGIKEDEIMLPNQSVSDFMFDMDRNLWVSTLESGVYMQPAQPAIAFAGIPVETGLIKSVGDNLLVGYGNNQIKVFNGQNWQKIEIPDFPNRQFTDFEKDGNTFLLGSNSACYRLDKQWKIIESLRNKRYKSDALVIDIEPFDKDRLWATHRRGICLIQNNEVDKILPSIHRTGKLKWWKNKLWSATDYGLNVYQWKNEKLHLVKVLYEGLNIKNLKIRDNFLWASVYENGLVRLDSTLQPLVVKGLENVNRVFDFYFLGPNQIFLSGSQGLFLGHFNEAKDAIKLKRRLFTKPVFQIEFFQNHLWLGTKQGLFKIALPIRPQAETQILLIRFESGNAKRPFKDGMEILYDNRQLSFLFDFFNYSFDNLRLVAQLDGPLPWKGSSLSGQLNFQNLPSGSYTLQLKVVDEAGLELPGHRTLKFQILPAFWETWWFKLLAILAISAIILVVTGLTVRYYRRKDAEANRLQQLIASYKITALQSQMNPHFVSNALTAIQNLILSENIKEANNYLTKFSRMLRQVLELSSRPTISLENELAIIRLNVELEALRFSQKFDFQVMDESQTPLNQLFIPTLITQPFVENAIWHGLLPLPKDQKGHLVIRIQRENEKTMISIEDNGMGRRKKIAENQEKKSLSQLLTISRIENLNRILGKEDCAIEIIDLENEAGEPAGTKVVLTFPANLNTLPDESLFAR